MKDLKNLAKSLATNAKALGVNLKLNVAQQIIARMGGYDAWQALATIKPTKPSKKPINELLTMNSILAEYGLSVGLSDNDLCMWEWFEKKTGEFKNGFSSKEEAYMSARQHIQEYDDIPALNEDGEFVLSTGIADVGHARVYLECQSDQEHPPFAYFDFNQKFLDEIKVMQKNVISSGANYISKRIPLLYWDKNEEYWMQGTEVQVTSTGFSFTAYPKNCDHNVDTSFVNLEFLIHATQEANAKGEFYVICSWDGIVTSTNCVSMTDFKDVLDKVMCNKVEYDLNYFGGDYSDNGEVVYIPVMEETIQETFTKMTGINAVHIIHHSQDELFSILT